MGAAISQELRDKAVDEYLARKAADPSNTTIEGVAEKHGIGPASLKRFLRARRGGSPRAVLPNRMGPKPRLSAAEKEQVVEFTLADPLQTLAEIAAGVSAILQKTVSETTVRRCLKEKGLAKRALRKAAAPSATQGRSEASRRYSERHRRAPEPRAHRRSYPSDFTHAEWAFYQQPFESFASALPVEHETREILEAIRYINGAGCPWRYLPHDFPPHTTVRRWFDTWTRDGSFEKMNDWLRRGVRRAAGLEETPSYLIIDSQSTKTTEGGAQRGYDGGKQVNGRKRHVAVDSMGLPWMCVVHSAGIQDRDAVALLISDDVKLHLPRLREIVADGGYSGRCVEETHARTGVPMRIIRRSDSYGAWHRDGDPTGTRPGGFVPLPIRWKAERSIGWGSRRRRLAKDHERTTAASCSWMVLSFQHIMVARMAS